MSITQFWTSRLMNLTYGLPDFKIDDINYTCVFITRSWLYHYETNQSRNGFSLLKPDGG